MTCSPFQLMVELSQMAYNQVPFDKYEGKIVQYSDLQIPPTADLPPEQRAS